jgi:hypothetical protein
MFHFSQVFSLNSCTYFSSLPRMLPVPPILSLIWWGVHCVIKYILFPPTQCLILILNLYNSFSKLFLSYSHHQVNIYGLYCSKIPKYCHCSFYIDLNSRWIRWKRWCIVLLKYMIMSRHQNSGQNQNIRIANEPFENVTKFKYLETTLTNQTNIPD